MKLITFTVNDLTSVGVLDGEEVVNLSDINPKLPKEMCALLAADAFDDIERAISSGKGRLPAGRVTLQAPILRPPKILAVGLNYKDHIEETGMKTPKYPMIFNKQSTAVIGPGQGIHVPRASSQVDYEGELGVVIGRRCRHVPKNRATEVIAGYTIAHDVSVRDWQIRVPTFTMGKSFDTHCPLGPYIVTSDEIANPHDLDLKTWVNDELRQSSNTCQLLFNCFELVEHLSTSFTLEPGDIISTGTPSGVGFAMKPPNYLRPGDTVRIAIDRLGELENSVISEPESTPLI